MGGTTLERSESNCALIVGAESFDAATSASAIAGKLPSDTKVYKRATRPIAGTRSMICKV
jgi:hypothetical protein